MTDGQRDEGGLARAFDLHHAVSRDVRAIRDVGLEVVDCVEPEHGPDTLTGHLTDGLVPDAVLEADGGRPLLLVRHLRVPR